MTSDFAIWCSRSIGTCADKSAVLAHLDGGRLQRATRTALRH